MIFLWAFIIGGAICIFGQICFDVFKLTPAHTMTLLVVLGALLDGVGVYDPLIKFAGAGASVPITSFGNALVHGALEELKKRRVDRSYHGNIQGNERGYFGCDYFFVFRFFGRQAEGLR